MLVRLYFHLLKTLSLAAGCFLLVAASAQTSQSTVAGISDPDAISDHAHSILEHGLRVTGLTAKDWKPWHLKANYQIANQGTANGTGTVEGGGWDPISAAPVWDGTWARVSGNGVHKLQTKAPVPYVPVDLRVAAPVDPLRWAKFET
jgi:hypothetical protein